jgi:hypothetical protein
VSRLVSYRSGEEVKVPSLTVATAAKVVMVSDAGH